MKAKAKEITPQELAGIIRRHPRVAALTGAGISVASGIPDFRSPGASGSALIPWSMPISRPSAATRPRSGNF